MRLGKNTIISLILMTLGITTLLTISSADTAYAKHQGSNQFLEYERHVWSRDSSDGHTRYLNCGAGSNDDKCAVKIKVSNDISRTGVSKASAINELDKVETRFDNANKKISFDKTTRNILNTLTGENLMSNDNGYTDYDLHCTEERQWYEVWRPLCITKDKHFVKMTVKINSNNVKNWGTTEICDTDNQPTQRDIEKTIGHEMTHFIGLDHSSSSSDLRFNTYQCGANYGYNPSTADKNKMEQRYP